MSQLLPAHVMQRPWQMCNCLHSSQVICRFRLDFRRYPAPRTNIPSVKKLGFSQPPLSISWCRLWNISSISTSYAGYEAQEMKVGGLSGEYMYIAIWGHSPARDVALKSLQIKSTSRNLNYTFLEESLWHLWSWVVWSFSVPNRLKRD